MMLKYIQIDIDLSYKEETGRKKNNSNLSKCYLLKNQSEGYMCVFFTILESLL